MSLRPKILDFSSTFETLKNGLDQIFQTSDCTVSKSSKLPIQAMNLYQTVYDLCNAYPKSFGDDLLMGIIDYLNGHCSRVIDTLLSKNNIVAAYTEEWNMFRDSSEYTNNVCEFLNRYMTRVYDPNRTQNLASRLTVKGHAYTAWKRQILAALKKNHSNCLIIQLMEQIRQARDGEKVNLETLAICIQSLVELNSFEENGMKLYEEEFHALYISRTNLYYLTESTQAITTLSMSEFMEKALSRLEEEETRSQKLCHESGLAVIRSSCEKHYITIHKEKIELEFEACIFKDEFEVAALAYQLLKKLENGLEHPTASFQTRITSLAKTFIASVGPDPTKVVKEYIEGLIAIQKKYMDICAKYFPSPDFVAAVDKAFRVTLNEGTDANTDEANEPAANKSQRDEAGFMAKYCDMLLRKTKLVLSETEVEEKLSDVINLFKYLDDKDIFQKYYARSLAKRLIHATSVSEDAELNMISKLKATCGFEYTFKLQRMFTDMVVSKELNSSFQIHLAGDGLSHVSLLDERGGQKGVESVQKKNGKGLFKNDFFIHVLTAGSWPLTPSNTEFSLPQELEVSASAFTDFFSTRHSGRKLTWFHHLSKADVRLYHFDKPYELSISLYQLGVLLLFNDNDSTNTEKKLTFDEIREATRLSAGELQRALKPFVELKLLLVEGSAPTHETSFQNATFSVNSAFTNKRTKMKALALGSGENTSSTKEELSSTRKAIDEDRRLYLQAAIVRIMKSRKELGHTPLVQAVLQLAKSRFLPSVGMIKKCIEVLIENGYIGRKEGVNDMYIYLS